MPHFGINQLLLSPLKCAICSGITVRFAPDLLCDLKRNYCAIGEPAFG